MRRTFHCVLIATTASSAAWALSSSSSSSSSPTPFPRVILASDDAPRAAKSAAAQSVIQVQIQQKTLERQREAAAVALEFSESPFDPWITNPHVQTIGGFFLRDTAAAYVPRNNPDAAVQRIWQGVQEKVQQGRDKKDMVQDFWDTRERIETKNGDDWFHVDSKYYGRVTNNDNNHQRPKHVILIHGLESNSNSSLTQQIAQACGTSGAATTVTCINFRSCSVDEQGKPIPNQTPAGYHLGFTDDLIHYLELLKAQERDEDVYLVGFSLGANVVLKALGELGIRAMDDFSIRGAAAACAPLEQEANARALAQPGINREVYTNSLLKSLKAKALDQWHKYGPPEQKNDPIVKAAIAEYKKGLAATTADWASKVAVRTQFSLAEDPEFETLIQDYILGNVAQISEYWNRHSSSSLLASDSISTEAKDEGRFLSQAPQQQVAFAAKQLWKFGTADLGQVQRGVPRSTILNAAVGASLLAAPVLGVGSVAAGLVAAFVTVQQGPLGTSLRLAGNMFTTASYVAKVAYQQALLMKEQEEEQVNQQLLSAPKKVQQPQLQAGESSIVSATYSTSSSSSLAFVDRPSDSGSLTYVDRNGALGTEVRKSRMFDLARALGAKTITEFDDAFIAPIYGFEDCWDYYRQTSSTYYLEEIMVPTLVMNAADDPFFDPAVFPVEKTAAGGGRAPVKMVRTPAGGHLGFCFHQVDEDDDKLWDSSGISWMPRELARFLQHVQSEQAIQELEQKRQQLTPPLPPRQGRPQPYIPDQQQKPKQSDFALLRYRNEETEQKQQKRQQPTLPSTASRRVLPQFDTEEPTPSQVRLQFDTAEPIPPQLDTAVQPSRQVQPQLDSAEPPSSQVRLQFDTTEPIPPQLDTAAQPSRQVQPQLDSAEPPSSQVQPQLDTAKPASTQLDTPPSRQVQPQLDFAEPAPTQLDTANPTSRQVQPELDTAEPTTLQVQPQFDAAEPPTPRQVQPQAYTPEKRQRPQLSHFALLHYGTEEETQKPVQRQQPEALPPRQGPLQPYTQNPYRPEEAKQQQPRQNMPQPQPYTSGERQKPQLNDFALLRYGTEEATQKLVQRQQPMPLPPRQGPLQPYTQDPYRAEEAKHQQPKQNLSQPQPYTPGKRQKPQLNDFALLRYGTEEAAQKLAQRQQPRSLPPRQGPLQPYTQDPYRAEEAKHQQPKQNLSQPQPYTPGERQKPQLNDFALLRYGTEEATQKLAQRQQPRPLPPRQGPLQPYTQDPYRAEEAKEQQQQPKQNMPQPQPSTPEKRQKPQLNDFALQRYGSLLDQ